MALQEVTAGNFFKLNDMKIGQTFKCYPIKVVDVTVQGRPAKNILVVNAETNEKITVGTPGNIKYLVNDGKLEMGVYTEITRGEDKKYGALKGSSFKVAQDPEKTLSDTQFAAIDSADLSTTTKSKPKFDVAATAAALSKQAQSKN